MSVAAKGLPYTMGVVSNKNLVGRLQAKSEEAAAELVDTYSDRLLRVATLILKDRHLAEDIVQESLIDAITHIGQFRGEASLYSWLYTILVRRCRKHQRKKAWNMLSFWPKEWLGAVQDKEPTAAQQLEQKEERTKVWQAVSRLPLHYREIVVLFYYEEISVQEVASIVGEPVGTVKSRLHRARKRLYNILAEEGEL